MSMFHYNLFDVPKVLTKKYIQRVGAALEKVTQKRQQGIINIITVGPEEIAFLNSAYRGKEGPTDILTFPYRESVKTDEDIAGEIYLCLDRIRAYASERGVTESEQLKYIIVHGMVHMMGYDHEREKDEKEMHHIEQSLLSLLAGEK